MPEQTDTEKNPADNLIRQLKVSDAIFLATSLSSGGLVTT